MLNGLFEVACCIINILPFTSAAASIKMCYCDIMSEKFTTGRLNSADGFTVAIKEQDLSSYREQETA